MSFPNPPIPDQEYTHSNGITYIFSDTKKAWEIKYEQATNTASLPLVNPSGRYMLTGGASLPDSGGLLTQSDYNTWAFNSLVKVDETSRVDAGETAPGDADTNQLWYKPSTGSLYVYYNDGSSSQWVEIGGGGGPSNTYTIETDPDSGFPQIKLVDQDGASSEVHFTATGELSVSSNATGITYGVNLSPYATKTYSDAGDLFLQNQLDDLEIEKGAVATYDCVDTQLGMTNARTGECIFSSATASAAIIIGFGTEDKSGNLTHPIHNGDIIEVIAPGGVVSRYTVTDNASAPAMVAVDFVSGDQTFSSGTEYSVYIYPQNAAGVSKEYVDDQDALKLNLTGGDLTGSLHTDSLIKSTRTSGYAFQVYDSVSDSNPAFIHSNGNIRGAQGTFTDTLEVRQDATFKKDIITDQAVIATGNVNSNGGWVGGNWGFYNATKGTRFYLEDRSTHFADITRQGVVLQNLMYADNMWTLKVQDSSNANNKTLIYGDYTSGLILNEVGELNTNGNVSIGGNLSFSNGGTINVSSGNTVLSGRASLDIKTAADYPVVISSGSSYKKVLSIYGFDNSQDDNRGETAYVNADGSAVFSNVLEINKTRTDSHSGFTIKGTNADGDESYILQAYHNAGSNPDAVNYFGKMDSANNIVTKEYVDSVASVAARPPGLKFRFGNGTTTAVIRHFNYYDDGGLKMRISLSSQDVEWCSSPKAEDNKFGNNIKFAVYGVIDSTTWKIIRHGIISRIDQHTNDILCFIDSHATNGSLTATEDYFITIGGLF